MRKNRFDLLYAGGGLAGLIETIDQQSQLLIVNVAVSPGFQGRGLGSTLMAQAEDIAAALGHHRVWLYTDKRFAENIALYLKLGYRVDSEEDIGIGLGIRVDMSKALGPG